jgi:putative transposase
MRTFTAIELSPLQKKILEEMIRCRLLPHSLVQRAKIVLQSAEGAKNKVISADLKIKEKTVGTW